MLLDFLTYGFALIGIGSSSVWIAHHAKQADFYLKNSRLPPTLEEIEVERLKLEVQYQKDVIADLKMTIDMSLARYDKLEAQAERLMLMAIHGSKDATV